MDCSNDPGRADGQLVGILALLPSLPTSSPTSLTDILGTSPARVRVLLEALAARAHADTPYLWECVGQVYIGAGGVPGWWVDAAQAMGAPGDAPVVEDVMMARTPQIA